MPNARLNGRIAQRLKRSSRRAAPPTFQNGTWIRLGLDRQRNRQAAALFANRLEGLPVNQGDARFKTHVFQNLCRIYPFGLQQSAMIARLQNAQLKTCEEPARASLMAQNPGSRCVLQWLSAFNPNGPPCEEARRQCQRSESLAPVLQSHAGLRGMLRIA